MSDLATKKLAERKELQRKIEANELKMVDLEIANRAKRRSWLKNEFYKRSNSQAPNKFGESKSRPIAAE